MMYVVLPEDGAKYDFEVIESGATGRLRIDCVIRQCHENQVDKIERALVALANLLKNGISIGARTMNGLGRVTCKDISLEYYDFTKPEHVKRGYYAKQVHLLLFLSDA